MKNKNLPIDEAQGDTFTVSISDLMSGLLAIFILILSNRYKTSGTFGDYS